MKRTHLLLAAVMASVLMMLVAACGSPDPTATSIPTPSAPADPTPTLSEADLFQVEWDALIAAAKEEGKLVVAGGGGVEPMEPIYEIFTKKFGVQVVLGRGSSSEHAERILAEQSGGRFEVDVAHSGANSANRRYIPNGMAQPLEPFFFHPEVVDKSLWFGGRYWWTDAEQQYHFVMTSDVSSAAGISVWFNTNLVSLEDVLAWDSHYSLFSDENKGKIVALSHLVGGATGGDLKTFLDPLQGPEWFERLYLDMDVFFTSDFQIIINGLSLGRFHYGTEIGTASRDLRSIRSLGGPVEEYENLFELGKVPGVPTTRTLDATGGAAGMLLLMRNVPHPNATKLYVNWILSREGQQAIHDSVEPGDPPGTLHDRVSVRRDVEPGLTRPERRWVDGETYANIDMQPDLRPLADEVNIWLRTMERERRKVEWPFDPETYREKVFLQ